MIEIPSQLKIHPEVGSHSEKLCQPKGGTRRHAPTLVDDFVDALVGDANGVCQFALGQAHRVQEFFQQHLARMGGRAMSGDSNHIFTIYWSSVIVDDFYLIRAIVRPDKADAILV